MRIGKITSGAEYRMDKQIPKFVFLISMVFEIEKILKIC